MSISNSCHELERVAVTVKKMSIPRDAGRCKTYLANASLLYVSGYGDSSANAWRGYATPCSWPGRSQSGIT